MGENVQKNCSVFGEPWMVPAFERIDKSIIVNTYFTGFVLRMSMYIFYPVRVLKKFLSA
jgi:hypothetical protein